MISIGEVVLLDLAEPDLGVFEGILLVDVQPARVVRVCVGQKQRLYVGRIDADLPAAGLQAGVILVPRVDGDQCFALANEEDVYVVFPDAADPVRQPPGLVSEGCRAPLPRYILGTTWIAK